MLDRLNNIAFQFVILLVIIIDGTKNITCPSFVVSEELAVLSIIIPYRKEGTSFMNRPIALRRDSVANYTNQDHFQLHFHRLMHRHHRHCRCLLQSGIAKHARTADNDARRNILILNLR